MPDIDFAVWAPALEIAVVGLMFVGGMAGSTAGGIKSLRVLLGLRALRATVARIIHPHVVRTVHYRGRPVSDEVVIGIGTSVPTFSSAFFPSAARRRGEDKSRTVESVCRKRKKTVEGTVTTQSARLSDDRNWARTLVKPPSPSSPSWPVGASVMPAS